MTMMHCERSTRRLSPSVSVALSRMPSSNCQSESEAFSISSNSRIESFSFSVCHWFSASCVSRGWVSRCPRYPGGEPISFAISCECWNSAQSILMQAPRDRRTAIRPWLPPRASCPNRSAPGRADCRPDVRAGSARPETSGRSQPPSRVRHPDLLCGGAGLRQIPRRRCCGGSDPVLSRDSFSYSFVLPASLSAVFFGLSSMSCRT